MALAYIDKYSEGILEDFIRRVSIALAMAAFDKVGAGFSPGDDGTRERRLVQAILRNPRELADAVALDITSNSTIDNNSNDTTIQSAVDSNFTLLARIFDDENLL